MTTRSSVIVVSLMVVSNMAIFGCQQEIEIKRSRAMLIPNASSSETQAEQKARVESNQSSPQSSPNSSPGSSPQSSPDVSPGSSPSKPRSHAGSGGCMAYLMYDCPSFRQSPVHVAQATLKRTASSGSLYP